MMNLVYTRHAEARMQQRGTRTGDEELVLEFGTQIDDETWLLLDRDVKQAMVDMKRTMQRLSRLSCRKVVLRGDRVITSYQSRPGDQKRTLRRGRKHGMV